MPSLLSRRLATADVQLDHASISRQHALLCFRPSGAAVLMDLDSAHGTLVGSERLVKVGIIDKVQDSAVTYIQENAHAARLIHGCARQCTLDGCAPQCEVITCCLLCGSMCRGT